MINIMVIKMILLHQVQPASFSSGRSINPSSPVTLVVLGSSSKKIIDQYLHDDIAILFNDLIDTIINTSGESSNKDEIPQNINKGAKQLNLKED
jgi:hypothetical protein